ncbi:Alpha/Beta hydrolase protein [Boeremia exigua]|uniref:Alpha/Beta hydrolase protein n=1 Tax=Boeremia exigua TaxID=749465 RepID=UPI001E8E4A6F|nr:Alpha/Beta hydrolase protein [Boeremia exigua]KAH6637867.1 Alpha/Beta hydrolase protein [Boeremia exigua]
MTDRSFFNLSFLALLALPAVSSSVVPIIGPHRFDVGISTAALTDTGRVDPFAKDGGPRRIMVSTFAPVANCRNKKVEAYMPPATAAFEDEKFAAYGLPNGSFSALQLETCKSITNRSTKRNSFPLVIFSGALGTSRLLYSGMLQSVAAAGYLVVSLDHSYDSDVVEFPGGNIVQGVDISDDALDLALSARVADITYVYQQLQNQTFANAILPGYSRACAPSLRKTAVIGHSFGGAAAAAAMLAIPSIRGGINLDGSLFEPVISSGLKQPFMLMGHENKTQETDHTWKATWPKLAGWKREFEVKHTAHYSFSDFPLITEVLGLQGHLPEEVGQLLGTIEGARMMNLTVSYITAFLDRVLKGESGRLLDGGKEFPEVVLRAK